MVINREFYERNGHVKFISYMGRFPNMCRGVLTLEIDGKRYTFGCPFGEPHPDFGMFWTSGGDVSDNDNVQTGEWIINMVLLPMEFHEYADEIDRVFNENVEYGCCGGCT